ncbi:hypothetical protein WN48_08956 [Eufriesea mexicana]|uniref:Uncharacterized protein n=1 Tax=Eufriesea mexicana TaxID=516756 RepID=A0A310SSX8_9HYME|nr:hypothetical protein WN48_08956 [Eufriesea mexicana]
MLLAEILEKNRPPLCKMSSDQQWKSVIKIKQQLITAGAKVREPSSQVRHLEHGLKLDLDMSVSLGTGWIFPMGLVAGVKGVANG